MYEYVSDAVEAGSAAFNNFAPWKLCHAFEDLSTSIPVVSKQVLDVHILSSPEG